MVHFMTTLNPEYDEFLSKHEFFNVFRDHIRKTFCLFTQAKEQTDRERQSGTYNPIDFTTHTTYDCCIVRLVGSFEYLIKQISADTREFPRNGSTQSLNTIDSWLNNSFGFQVSDILSDKDFTYLKILFQYRHIIVHNAGLYDRKSIEAIKPFYNRIGWDTSRLVENKSILWDPEHIEPMFRIIYKLSEVLMVLLMVFINILGLFLLGMANSNNPPTSSS